jgi:hypothetical protein
MPFVTKSGGFCLDDGVVQTHKSVEGKVVLGNKIKTEVLANIGATGLDPETEDFKCAVRRGTPRPDGSSWESTPVPVFIIQHYNFEKEVWDRFWKKFLRQLKDSAPSFHYEPDVVDVIDLEFGKRQMPTEILLKIIELGLFDKALVETKVESTAKKLTQRQYDLIMKAIDTRLKEEGLKEVTPVTPNPAPAPNPAPNPETSTPTETDPTVNPSPSPTPTPTGEQTDPAPLTPEEQEAADRTKLAELKARFEEQAELSDAELDLLDALSEKYEGS